jgi:hypothetical protein
MRSSSPESNRFAGSLDLATLPFLILLYLLAIVAVNPTGNFPLNDDWAYAAAARSLALEHNWMPNGWTAMTLITQSFWAAPFCIFSNCTFEALRASNLAAGGLLLISSYCLFRSVTKSAMTAALSAAIVAFNPVTFELSYTFMTDTLFSALLVISTVVFLKTFCNRSTYLFALACLLAVAATLCRQIGLCLPFAYAVVILFRSDDWSRKIYRSLVLVILCVLAFVAFNYWMQQTGRTPANYGVKSQELIDNIRRPIYLIQKVGFNVVATLLYLVLFCSPLLILRKTPANDQASPLFRWLPTAVAAAAALAACGILWLKPGLMPIGGNILVPQGLGPLTLRDTYTLGLPNVAPLSKVFWLIVTALSLFGLFRLVELVCAFAVSFFDRDREPIDAQAESFFAVVCTVIYFSPLFLISILDRYIADIVPLVCLFILAFARQTQTPVVAARILAGGICAGFAIYAVLGTHDYLSWNRARWQAIAGLQRLDGANSDNTDGGFEFNGSTSYDPNYRSTDGMSGWWIKADTYQVTFGAISGMTELRRYAYTTYLPPDTRYIHVLRRPQPVKENTNGQ